MKLQTCAIRAKNPPFNRKTLVKASTQQVRFNSTKEGKSHGVGINTTKTFDRWKKEMNEMPPEQGPDKTNLGPSKHCRGDG